MVCGVLFSTSSIVWLSCEVFDTEFSNSPDSLDFLFSDPVILFVESDVCGQLVGFGINCVSSTIIPSISSAFGILRLKTTH